ncbi:MAG: DinB family protein [Dehalococcoidia bacterium]|nr:DinB family protein [Dehalococcoidia bacterium]
MTRIPDPTLMARLQLSIKGVEWAAGLVQPYQYEIPPDGGWTAHRQIWHLVDAEQHRLRPRLQALLEQDNPELITIGHEEGERYTTDEDITVLAQRMITERETTTEILKGLAEGDWSRKGLWADGRVVDVAWMAERCLWHGLDHFASLLRIHNDLEGQQALRWHEESEG